MALWSGISILTGRVFVVRVSDLLHLLGTVEDDRDGWLAHCPGHQDSQASLRVAVSDSGRVLLRCRAGCETKDVLSALELTMRDLATMEADERPAALATSRDAAPDGAAIAALAVQLDRWRSDEDGTDTPTRTAAGFFYAEERFGVDLDTFGRLGLGYAEDLPGGPRLVVPFRDPDGVPLGYQARALASDASIRWYGPPSPDGASWSKLGWLSGGTDWPEVLVTEGPGDGLTAAAVGYDAIMVRGASLAGNATVVDTIAAWAAGRPVVVAGDGDRAGQGFSSTLASALTERGLTAKILPVPDGHDLTSWRERDVQAFASELTRAVASAPVESSTSSSLAMRDSAAYPLTDVGNARFLRDFIASRGFGVKFSPEAGFFILSGGVWRPDKLDRTRAFAQEAAERTASIAYALLENAATADDEKRAKAWMSWAKYSQSSQGITAALRELQADMQVACDVNDFDRHEHLMACRNGVVNLRTGELQPHDPGLLITRRVDLDYDPLATAPRWESFLREVFPDDEELPGYMQRLTGYGVTGSTAEQCFAVFYGKGANGKSVFLDTLTEVFRELVTVTPFSTFEAKSNGGIPNDLAALKGARLVVASEGEQGQPMAEALLKRVTGRDVISARFMRREFFEFRPQFLLMMATNAKPRFRGQDEGLWRRVKLIPWARYFKPSERDPRLSAALLAEAQGILAWAVRGAVDWYAGGLRDPRTVIEGTQDYRVESDILAEFMDEWVADPDARVKAADAFAAFQQWADENNQRNLSGWSAQAFYSNLTDRGFPRRKSGGYWYILGLRRKKPSEH